jgi:hypothetical protein
MSFPQVTVSSSFSSYFAQLQEWRGVGSRRVFQMSQFVFNKREHARLWLSDRAKDSRACIAVAHISRCENRERHNRHYRSKSRIINKLTTEHTMLLKYSQTVSLFFVITLTVQDKSDPRFSFYRTSLLNAQKHELLLNNVKNSVPASRKNCNFACSFVWTWNLVSY